MKESCCNGVNKVHKIWETLNVTNNDISMKMIIKNVINVWVYVLYNASKWAQPPTLYFNIEALIHNALQNMMAGSCVCDSTYTYHYKVDEDTSLHSYREWK